VKKLLILLLLPPALFAATVDDLIFTLSDSGSAYSIGNCVESASGEMIIPSTYDGLPVTSIGGGAFSRCDSLTSVAIPSGVTSIGAHAFRYCSSLTSVVIGDSVTSIGEKAFAYGSSLTNITFEGNAPSVGRSAFGWIDPSATIYYYEGATGFTSPTWEGRQTEMLVPEPSSYGILAGVIAMATAATRRRR